MRFDIYKILSFALILVVQGVSYAQTCPDVFGDIDQNTATDFQTDGNRQGSFDCKLEGGDIEITAKGDNRTITVKANTIVVWDVDNVFLTSERDIIPDDNGNQTEIDKYGITLNIEDGAILYILGNLKLNFKSVINIASTGQLVIDGDFNTDGGIYPIINISNDQILGDDIPAIRDPDNNSILHYLNLHIKGNGYFGFTSGTSGFTSGSEFISRIYIEGNTVDSNELNTSVTTEEQIENYLNQQDWFKELNGFWQWIATLYYNIALRDNFPGINGESNEEFRKGLTGGQPSVELPDLPVELTYFNAFIENKTVALEWETASEQNASHFDVQRSADQQNWTTIGMVNAQGNSNVAVEYEFIDEAPLSKAYYRLHQVDFDGLNEFFGPLYVTTTSVSEEFEVTLMPNNIVNGEEVHFRLSGGIPASMMSASMYDGTGRMLQSEEIELKQSATFTSLHLPSEMKPGVYYVVFRNGKSIARKRLIVR
ncbi:T9SS type A sorting domain-containing protein [Flammeovirga sp. SubArs3]|uniref:T9SS type A sorting domain-containing protein n=1 Tax=Flammeovirga sp. SubArs3 TaxID=2995316 RepID=UPI00248B1813|nr:T9SS type A sorting domain-containing protein [Flammeovirga sp. SubArs3]